MCERRSDSTTQPPSLPEPPGAFDDSFGYRVTEEGFKALAEYEKQHGKSMVRKVPLPDTVAEAIATEEWLEDRRQRRKKAREQGHRLVTVCGKWRGGRKIPDIRLIGLLEKVLPSEQGYGRAGLQEGLDVPRGGLPVEGRDAVADHRAPRRGVEGRPLPAGLLQGVPEELQVGVRPAAVAFSATATRAS